MKQNAKIDKSFTLNSHILESLERTKARDLERIKANEKTWFLGLVGSQLPALSILLSLLDRYQ